jgi:hypothetical protein
MIDLLSSCRASINQWDAVLDLDKQFITHQGAFRASNHSGRRAGTPALDAGTPDRGPHAGEGARPDARAGVHMKKESFKLKSIGKPQFKSTAVGQYGGEVVGGRSELSTVTPRSFSSSALRRSCRRQGRSCCVRGVAESVVTTDLGWPFRSIARNIA